MKIKEIGHEEKEPHPLVSKMGFKIEKLEITDIRLHVTGKFREFFEFEIPESLILPTHFKYEYIFDDEDPPKCISVETTDITRESSYFLRGVFSVKKDERWFQHLRYTIKHDNTITFILRTLDHGEKDCDPYSAFTKLDEYGFYRKFQHVLKKMKEFIHKNKKKLIHIKK